MANKFLFGRIVSVLILSDDKSASVKLDGFNLDLRTGFDIDGHVVKSSESDGNKVAVRIFNLPDEYRKAFQKSGAKFAITAGHKLAGNVSSLGVFDVHRAHHETEEGDTVFHIEAAESQSALVDAQVSLSFSAGQTVGSIAKPVVKALTDLGIGAGNFARTLGASTLTYPNGAVLEGRARDRLRALSHFAGFEFSVQNGALLFLEQGQPDRTIRVVNLGPDTGLIGVPKTSDADPKKKKPAQIKVKAMLQPQIVPGSLINVDLPPEFDTRGLMKVTKVDQNFSTYAQPFYSDMDCELVT